MSSNYLALTLSVIGDILLFATTRSRLCGYFLAGDILLFILMSVKLDFKGLILAREFGRLVISLILMGISYEESIVPGIIFMTSMIEIIFFLSDDMKHNQG